MLPPPPPRMEDVPFPPPPPHTEDVPFSPPPQSNEISTNLVNLLQQENNRVERVERNQENISTKFTMKIKVTQRNKCHETLVVVDDAVSVPVNYRKGGGKPPNNSDKGNMSQSSHHSLHG